MYGTIKKSYTQNKRKIGVIAMELIIKNIGKIEEAIIKINGITVIAGENNTGKSTVGKILFSLFSSMNKLDKKINEERRSAIEKLIIDFEEKISTDEFNLFSDYNNINKFIDQILELDFKNSFNDIRQKIDNILKDEIIEEDISNDKQKLIESICKIMEISKKEYTISILEKIFKQEFNGQINNIFSESIAEIELRIKERAIRAEIMDDSVTAIDNEFSLNKEVIYIDDPFILDELNPIRFNLYRRINLTHKWHLIKQIFRENDSNIFNNIITEKKLNNIIMKFNSVSSGNLVNTGRSVEYRLKDTDKTLNAKNLSAGLKTFVILKELLLTGTISDRETIVLDEPEIHLHPEWQLILAELIVLLQKEFDLHILLTTHSPYFLNAIEVFTKKYGIEDKCNYYLATRNGNSAVFNNVNNNLEEIYKLLAKPLQTLENKRYEVDDEV